MVSSAVRRATAYYDVVIRNALPYCPRCNRQVSYRREYCRACGYCHVSYESSPTDDGADARSRIPKHERVRPRYNAAGRGTEQEAKRKKWQEEQEAQRQQRRAEREAYYRSRGVEPGPWAWYKVLPEWGQAVLLGLAISAPVLVIAVVFALAR
jgi:hypothetical protein